MNYELMIFKKRSVFIPEKEVELQEVFAGPLEPTCFRTDHKITFPCSIEFICLLHLSLFIMKLMNTNTNINF